MSLNFVLMFPAALEIFMNFVILVLVKKLNTCWYFPSIHSHVPCIQRKGEKPEEQQMKQDHKKQESES